LAQVKVGVPTATWTLLESNEHWPDWGRAKAKLVSVNRP
jgi:phosphohistidine phosphatase